MSCNVRSLWGLKTAKSRPIHHDPNNQCGDVDTSEHGEDLVRER